MANERRLIDANALYTEVKESSRNAGFFRLIYDGFLNTIEKTPTVAAVEVCYCKDCKYCNPETTHCDHVMGTQLPYTRGPCDFCSYGEKSNQQRRDL